MDIDKIKEKLMEVDYVWLSREENKLTPQVETALNEMYKAGMEEGIKAVEDEKAGNAENNMISLNERFAVNYALNSVLIALKAHTSTSNEEVV
jgi:tRNA A37 N6-isopentenylltransferase MiaA